MLIRHLHNVHELPSVLAQPTAEMQRLREVLCEQGRFPTRRTWERRFQAIPATLPAQIGCLGRHLLDLIQLWVKCGRAAAIDSIILRARGGVWHQKHREQGELPHTDLACMRDGNGMVAGFIGIAEGKVEMLFIHPEYREQGIGRTLLRYAIHERGATTVDVNEQNDQALGFYLRMGFVVVGRSELDSNGKPYPLLHMRLARGNGKR